MPLLRLSIVLLAGLQDSQQLKICWVFFLTKRLQRYIETVNQICSVSLC